MNVFSHQCRNCHISCYEWAGSVWVALVTYIPSRLPKSHACCFLRDSVNGATILNSQLPKGFPSKINLAPMCFPLGRSCTTHRQTLLSVVFSCSLLLSAESEVHPEELWSICPNDVLLCISNVIISQIVLPCSFLLFHHPCFSWWKPQLLAFLMANYCKVTKWFWSKWTAGKTEPWLKLRRHCSTIIRARAWKLPAAFYGHITLFLLILFLVFMIFWN